MHDAPQLAVEQHPGGGRFQFSLRGLLQLMFAVAVICGVGAVCRESEQFQGICCLWSLLAVLFVGAIWIAYRMRLVGPRLLAYGSLVIYLIALSVPAWSNTEVLFGAQLAWSSTMLTVTLNLFDRYTGGWFGVAIALGGVANLTFLIGYINLLVGIQWPRARTVAGWFAALSVVAAVATVPTMAVSSSNWSVFPTFGLWLASPWALSLGTWGMRTPAAKKAPTV
jgi:hypothetical protein